MNPSARQFILVRETSIFRLLLDVEQHECQDERFI
jgi:hypothetical protein